MADTNVGKVTQIVGAVIDAKLPKVNCLRFMMR